MPSVNVLVEGITDEAVVRRLFDRDGITIEAVHGLRGKRAILQNIDRYNRAAKHTYWFVMVDLDHDADCVIAFLQSTLHSPSSGMHFRVVVRELEAWLLADRAAFAKFFDVSPAKLPMQPELEANPKQTLINCVASSRKKSIREAIVPRPNSDASVGPLYSSTIRDYVRLAWRPNIASLSSRSLAGAMRTIDAICLRNDAPSTPAGTSGTSASQDLALPD